MRFFLSYLKSRIKLILASVLFCAVFAVCFAIYRFPAEAVLYPALICAVLGIIFVIADFSRAKKKHDCLKDIKKMSAAVLDGLPDIKTVDDADYQDIINTLTEEFRRAQTEHNSGYADMIDYYTVWAHQIKTPIASMRLILEGSDSPESRRLSVLLSKIEQYVNMVLVYLRLNSTSTDYLFREYRLDDIIKGSVKRFSLDFIEKKIRLEYLPLNKTIVTDEKWFGFVLDQVISNALKYTREGCVKIYLSSENTLCIEDTGIGISEEDIPRIFDKGYTGRNGRIDMRASGLGLYLCKRICDNLGFKISASSKDSCGTKIFIDISQPRIKTE